MIDAFDLDRYEVLVSTALLLEYEMVLMRPEQTAVHGFSAREIDVILNTLAAKATRVTQYYDWKPQLHDPNDELVLSVAINGGADAIITHNVKDFLPVALTFGIEVFTPGRMIKERFGS